MSKEIPKDYSEILELLISKINKLATWKETDDANDYRLILTDFVREFNQMVLDRNYYELYLDEERARKQEEYNTWKDENKEQVES